MPPGLFIKRRAVWLSCVFATTLALGWIFWPTPAPIAEPLPSPNGYDDFVRAGKLLIPVSSDYKKLPLDQLRALVKTNEEPLRLVRLGLGRECRKPVEYNRNYFQTFGKDLDTIRQLARLLAVEGLLEEEEERYRNAAMSYCDSIKLGVRSAKGGLVIDHLVGIICESIGISGLERVVGKLSAGDARIVLNELIETEAATEQVDAFLAREQVFSKHTIRISERLRAMWDSKTLSPERAGLTNYPAKVHQSRRRRQEMTLRLAAQIYRLEKGSPPRQMSDLVPDILPTIPVDPETGTNLVLNPSK